MSRSSSALIPARPSWVLGVLAAFVVSACGANSTATPVSHESARRTGHVYWVNARSGTVKAVPIGGGRRGTVLASGQNYPVSVTVHGTRVYWVNTGGAYNPHTGTVNDVPIDGGRVTTLASGQNYPVSVAVHGTHVYWVTSSSSGRVNEVSLGGGRVTALAIRQKFPNRWR